MRPAAGVVHALDAPGWTTSLVVSSGSFTLQRHSDDPEYRARLVHAAALLRRISHPGVETFLALEDDGARTTLITAFAGGRSLVTDPPRRARDLARLGASLLETLSALHDAGVTHGPVTAAAVRLHSAAFPVLCGFTDGRARSGDDPRSWWITCAVEEQSVGRLLEDLLEADEPVRRPGFVEWFDRRRLARLGGRIRRGEIADAAGAVRTLRRFGRGSSGHRALRAGRRHPGFRSPRRATSA